MIVINYLCIDTCGSMLDMRHVCVYTYIYIYIYTCNRCNSPATHRYVNMAHMTHRYVDMAHMTHRYVKVAHMTHRYVKVAHMTTQQIAGTYDNK